MTAFTKRHTDKLASGNGGKLTSALCPVCQVERPTFRDKSFTMFFARHQQAGRGGWCNMSGQKVSPSR